MPKIIAPNALLTEHSRQGGRGGGSRGGFKSQRGGHRSSYQAAEEYPQQYDQSQSYTQPYDQQQQYYDPQYDQQQQRQPPPPQAYDQQQQYDQSYAYYDQQQYPPVPYGTAPPPPASGSDSPRAPLGPGGGPGGPGVPDPYNPPSDYYAPPPSSEGQIPAPYQQPPPAPLLSREGSHPGIDAANIPPPTQQHAEASYAPRADSIDKELPDFFPNLDPMFAPKQAYDLARERYFQANKNYSGLTLRYNKLKDKYEASRKEIVELKKKLHVSRNNSIVDSTKSTHENEGENANDGINNLEELDSGEKDKSKISEEAKYLAVRSERDTYKNKTTQLASEIAKLKVEKTSFHTKSLNFEKELNGFKTKYLFLEKEKAELIAKIEALEKESESNNGFKSSIGSPLRSPGQEETEEDKSWIYKRKEYYKNKYQALLEEKDREQQAFLNLNKQLLEKFVFNAK